MGKRLSPGEIEQFRAREFERIRKETALERIWWGSETKFHTIAQAREALGQRCLVVVPRDGRRYRLIGRLSGTEQGEPNLLRPIAQKLLKYVSDIWARRMGTRADDIQLAVTSLYRTEVLQAALLGRADGYRAIDPQESSHLAGAAFDISCRSYYLCNKDTYVPIQSWKQETGEFDPTIFDRLREVLKDIARQDLCNFVIENNISNTGVEPSVYHICANPAFSERKLI